MPEQSPPEPGSPTPLATPVRQRITYVNTTPPPPSDTRWNRVWLAVAAIGLATASLGPLLLSSSAAPTAEAQTPASMVPTDGATDPFSARPSVNGTGSSADGNTPLSALPGLTVTNPFEAVGAVSGPGVVAGSAGPLANAGSPTGANPSPGVVQGIPGVVLAAYQAASSAIASSDAGCHLSWQVLAGIGKIESDHAEGGNVTSDGTSITPILGPVLDGSNGMSAIPDTDGGRWDGNTVWDRAVGPMQFIPSTWTQWAVTDRAGATPNPENVFDATLAAGHYLCASGGDLSTSNGLNAAILSYNHSSEYLADVLAWISAYTTGTVTAVSGSTTQAAGTTIVSGAAGTPSSTPAPGSSPSAAASAVPTVTGPTPTPSTTTPAPSASPSPTAGPTTTMPTTPPTATAPPSTAPATTPPPVTTPMTSAPAQSATPAPSPSATAGPPASTPSASVPATSTPTPATPGPDASPSPSASVSSGSTP